MQGPTHYLTSVILTIYIYKLLEGYDRRLVYSVIFLANYFFHAILDALADITYHPAESHWSDPVFASWHLFLYVFEFVVALYLMRRDLRYVPGMLGSVGFDLWDWSIVRPMDKFFDIALPEVHWIADGTNSLFFFWLPNVRENAWALIVEIFIWLSVVLWWMAIRDGFDEERRPATITQLSILLGVFGVWRLLGLL